METLDAVAKQIHSEFKQSFEKSETQLIQTIDELQNTDRDTTELEKYTSLKHLGFTNSTTVIKADKITDEKYKLSSSLENLKKLQKQISEIRVKYPYKIISYGQIIAILEKYNLYIGRSENYIDIMPEYNAMQLLTYSKNMRKDVERSYTSSSILGALSDLKPICAQSITSIGYNQKEFNFYICAPHEMFKKSNDRFIVGREIFYNNDLRVMYKHIPTTITMDPVVLHPLNIDNPIAKELKLFHVATAWGPEAKEDAILDPKMN